MKSSLKAAIVLLCPLKYILSAKKIQGKEICNLLNSLQPKIDNKLTQNLKRCELLLLLVMLPDGLHQFLRSL